MIDPAVNRFQGQSGRIQLNLQKSLRMPLDEVRLVFVERVGPGGSVILRFGGRRLSATTSFPLRAGETYEVRSEVEGRQVLLRVLAQVPRSVAATEVAESLGMQPGLLSEAVVRAFLRSGLALEKAKLNVSVRKVAAARNGKVRESEFARLDALAARKGLDLTEGELLALLGGWTSNEDEGEPGERREKKQLTRMPTEQDVRRSFGAGPSASHALHYFNHIVGDGDHWIIVPLRVAESGLSASLRIRIPRGGALGVGPADAFREAALIVEVRNSRWVFSLRPKHGGIQAAFVSGPEGGEDALQRSGLGIAVETESVRRDGGHDGFSWAEGADIMKSVDSSV